MNAGAIASIVVVVVVLALVVIVIVTIIAVVRYRKPSTNKTNGQPPPQDTGKGMSVLHVTDRVCH